MHRFRAIEFFHCFHGDTELETVQGIPARQLRFQFRGQRFVHPARAGEDRVSAGVGHGHSIQADGALGRFHEAGIGVVENFTVGQVADLCLNVVPAMPDRVLRDEVGPKGGVLRRLSLG
jgi:hypothetical protein